MDVNNFQSINQSIFMGPPLTVRAYYSSNKCHRVVGVIRKFSNKLLLSSTEFNTDSNWRLRIYK
jgi:hypothetical protein